MNRNPQVPEKANLILHLILLAFALLVVRIWYLTVIDYDKRIEQSILPTRKKVVEPARRATIRDRFNLPLAMNRVQYNLSIHYARIRQLPSIEWETLPDGKRIKHYKRKEYVQDLSQFLAKELNRDPQEIEDLLYAKAAVYDQLPFPLHDHLSETQYYRLKARERQWVGLQTTRVPQRYYPMGPVAGDILGFMGTIQHKQMQALFREREELLRYIAAAELQEETLPPENIHSIDEAKQRLLDLEDKAYSAQDFVGKTGIEGLLEEELRGFQGKQFFHTDAKGRFLHSLHEKQAPLPGRRILLTLSAELQAYAEELLIRNEQIRSARVAKPYLPGEKVIPHKEPWIKGGAIIAMDPNTGEILALASYPRINPNDFIPSGNQKVDQDKKNRIRASLELESHLGSIWEGKNPLERETEDPAAGLSTEQQFLTWDFFVHALLDEGSEVESVLKTVTSMKEGIRLVSLVQQLQAILQEPNLIYLLSRLYEQEGHTPLSSRLKGSSKEQVEQQILLKSFEVAHIKKQLDQPLTALNHTYDKLLLLDILSLLCRPEEWSESLLAACGNISLADYLASQQAYFLIEEKACQIAKQIFKKSAFMNWRKAHFDAYLKEKRREEKSQKRFARPMTDYLLSSEKQFFESFWSQASSSILYSYLHDSAPLDAQYLPYVQALKSACETADLRKAYERLSSRVSHLSSALQEEYFRTFYPFNKLDKPLYGRYKPLRSENGVQKQKHLAIAWYPKHGFGAGRSWCYRQSAVQGSIFKLVPSYQALIERYLSLNPSLLIHRTQLNPLTLRDLPHLVGGVWHVGYTESGKSIPQNYKGGRLVRSLNRHIGYIDLTGALEMTSNCYFGLLAADHIACIKNLEETTKNFSYGAPTGIDLPGETGGKVPDDLEENQTGLYNFVIGQHTLVVTPLQTAVMLSSIGNSGKVMRPHVLHRLAGKKRGQLNGAQVTTIHPHIAKTLLMPKDVRDILLEGLYKVTQNIKANSLGALRSLYKKDLSALAAFIEMQGQMVGKTSTGESTEALSLERLTGTQTYNHVWFGALFFDPKEIHKGVDGTHFGKTDLVVVVYLRFGGLGKEALPIAAQVAQKWRQIQKRHGI